MTSWPSTWWYQPESRLDQVGWYDTFDATQSKYRLPDEMRTTKNRDELFGFIADSLGLLHQGVVPRRCREAIAIGFHLLLPSFPEQDQRGYLERWTKGFEYSNVEGHDVVALLQEQLTKRKVPVEVVALINDTTGTLVASLYSEKDTKMGVIFGTGVNGAYYDVVSDIPKLEGKLPADIPNDSVMAINCEYGSFDNEVGPAKNQVRYPDR